MTVLLIQIIIITFSANLYAQDVALKLIELNTFSLGIAHNQAIGMTYSLYGDFAPFASNCVEGTNDQDCESNITSGHYYSLVVDSTDELGLARSKTYNITTSERVCEVIAYKKQTDKTVVGFYTCSFRQLSNTLFA